MECLLSRQVVPVKEIVAVYKADNVPAYCMDAVVNHIACNDTDVPIIPITYTSGLIYVINTGEIEQDHLVRVVDALSSYKKTVPDTKWFNSYSTFICASQDGIEYKLRLNYGECYTNKCIVDVYYITLA